MQLSLSDTMILLGRFPGLSWKESCFCRSVLWNFSDSCKITVIQCDSKRKSLFWSTIYHIWYQFPLAFHFPKSLKHWYVGASARSVVHNYSTVQLINSILIKVAKRKENLNSNHNLNVRSLDIELKWSEIPKNSEQLCLTRHFCRWHC